jgi:hypothetical protein
MRIVPNLILKFPCPLYLNCELKSMYWFIFVYKTKNHQVLSLQYHLTNLDVSHLYTLYVDDEVQYSLEKFEK